MAKFTWIFGGLISDEAVEVLSDKLRLTDRPSRECSFLLSSCLSVKNVNKKDRMQTTDAT